MAAIQPRTRIQKMYLWLEQPLDEWETNDSYQSFKVFGTSIKVTNDVTKRGIRILKSISQRVKDPAQLQWLVQAVEHQRAQMPTVSKAAPRDVYCVGLSHICVVN